ILFLIIYKANAQVNTLVINNYSSLILEGVTYANAVSGSCYPAISSVNPTNFNIVVPAGTPSNPSTVSYDKYINGNNASTNYPLTQWWVQTASTSPPGYRPLLPTPHASFNLGGALDTNTNWTGFYFVTKDANNNYFEEHPIGNPAYYVSGCTPCAFSYNYAVYTEAEWFTIGNNTYVQVY